MQPLIDCDVLLYEVGFAVEAGWQSEGFPSFDYAAEKFDADIKNICAMVEATEPPILYLTGPGNFRHSIAKRQPYKERPSVKPFHYYNLKAYARGQYDCIVSQGTEADDEMAIEQTRRPNDTIICTRDKDLRAVPGWHYGWELGNQPQFGPLCVDELGSIRLSARRDKVEGWGLSFFYSQCITGDKVDTIPGLAKHGPVKAVEALEGCETEADMYEAVLKLYEAVYGPQGASELLEQGQLLWMTRYRDEHGDPVLWHPPK